MVSSVSPSSSTSVTIDPFITAHARPHTREPLSTSGLEARAVLGKIAPGRAHFGTELSRASAPRPEIHEEKLLPLWPTGRHTRDGVPVCGAGQGSSRTVWTRAQRSPERTNRRRGRELLSSPVYFFILPAGAKFVASKISV